MEEATSEICKNPREATEKIKRGEGGGRKAEEEREVAKSSDLMEERDVLLCPRGVDEKLPLIWERRDEAKRSGPSVLFFSCDARLFPALYFYGVVYLSCSEGWTRKWLREMRYWERNLIIIKGRISKDCESDLSFERRPLNNGVYCVRVLDRCSVSLLSQSRDLFVQFAVDGTRHANHAYGQK